MGAIRRLPALGTPKLVSGALLLTLLAAAVGLCSYSAIARGDQRPTTARHTAEKPTAMAAAASRFVVRHSVLTSPSGRTVVVRGSLLPAQRSAQVKLAAGTGGHWRTVATGRTTRNGRFTIRYRVRQVGTTALRVSYSGSARARSASAAAGRIVGLEPTIASWYYDEGNTACGFHATYGVANKTLPCGTKVTLSYGGHTVLATVDDRGPYVYGRSFDLNQNTARYLGMSGVAQVLASV